MREIFPREAADNPEPFTGERLTASVHGPVELEHYHRALFSRGFAAIAMCWTWPAGKATALRNWRRWRGM